MAPKPNWKCAEVTESPVATSTVELPRSGMVLGSRQPMRSPRATRAGSSTGELTSQPVGGGSVVGGWVVVVSVGSVDVGSVVSVDVGSVVSVGQVYDVVVVVVSVGSLDVGSVGPVVSVGAVVSVEVGPVGYELLDVGAVG